MEAQTFTNPSLVGQVEVGVLHGEPMDKLLLFDRDPYDQQKKWVVHVTVYSDPSKPQHYAKCSFMYDTHPPGSSSNDMIPGLVASVALKLVERANTMLAKHDVQMTHTYPELLKLAKEELKE